MKKFNLDEYLKNPERKVVTGDGRNVRIICTDRRNSKLPIIALIEEQNNVEEVYTLKKDGSWDVSGGESINDLYFAAEKHEGWINIFRGKDGSLAGNVVFASKEEAEESSRHINGFTKKRYLASVKVEWEE